MEKGNELTKAIAQVEMYAGALEVDAKLELGRPGPGSTVGLVLTDLFAAAPGNGAGTKVMTQLTSLALKLQVPVYLRPSSAVSQEFYKRFGFVQLPKHEAFMVRA